MSRYFIYIFFAHIFIGVDEKLLSQDSTYINSIGMSFVLIKPGSMIVGKFDPTVSKMGFVGPGGAPEVSDSILNVAEAMAKKDAMPGFPVSISHAYYLGKYEVTQAEWKKVMGNNPSVFQGNKVKDNAERHPVENVSWNDAQAFVQKLNAMEKGKAVYRLPTEFEWEYAARAGAKDDISWASIGSMAVIANLATMPVGTKKPNAWGLYDMLGNVWEWVQDFYNEKIFADPVPPANGKEHVLKGAPFYGDVKNATYMTHAAGPGSKYDTGFRLLMEVR
jgi:formylglycine-generating enzyme required for sulfatase activity